MNLRGSLLLVGSSSDPGPESHGFHRRLRRQAALGKGAMLPLAICLGETSAL